MIQGFASNCTSVACFLQKRCVYALLVENVFHSRIVKRRQRGPGSLDLASPPTGGSGCFASGGVPLQRILFCPKCTEQESSCGILPNCRDNIPRLSSYSILQDFRHFLASLNFFFFPRQEKWQSYFYFISLNWKPPSASPSFNKFFSCYMCKTFVLAYFLCGSGKFFSQR